MTKVNRYMFIVVIIISVFLREYNYYKENAKLKSDLYSIWLTDYSPTCWYASRNLVIEVRDCTNYPLGSKIDLIINRDILTANKSNESKFIDARHSSVVNIHSPSKMSLPNKIQAKLFTLRYQMRSSFKYLLPEKSAQLLFSLVFGGSSYLFPDHRDLIQVAGLQHLLAASGMQVSFLMIFVQYLMRPFPKQMAFVMSSLIIFVYAHLALLSISVIRACLMGFIALIARTLKVQYHPMWSLMIVAFLCLMISPSQVESIAFQLSFGVVLILQIFQQFKLKSSDSLLFQLETSNFTSLNQFTINNSKRWISLDIVKKYLIDSIQMSAIIQVFLLPLLLYHFAETNLVSILSTAAVSWFIPLTFIASLILILLSTILIGNISLVLFPLIGFPLIPMAFLLEFMLTFFKHTEWLRIQYAPSVVEVVTWYFCYFLIFILFLKISYKRSTNDSISNYI